MAGFSSSQNDNSPLSDINITPLVDVMLVLLIIFMVTAPLLESGIAVQLPKASSKALPKEESPVTLSINKDKQLFLNTQVVATPELISQLKIFYKARGKKEIFIRADGSIPYSFVAQTLAAVRSAGVTKIGLVTLPPDSKNPLAGSN